MTAHSLLLAVTAGLAAGVAGHLLACRGRAVPLWLPIAAGLAAAMLATVIARMANAERPEPALSEFVLQVLFAAGGVTLVALTAGPPAPGSGWRDSENVVVAEPGDR